MLKFFFKIISAVVAIASLCLPAVRLTACKKEIQRDSYKITAEYSDGKIQGKSLYTFTNNSDNTFKEVKFNLYANAYRSSAKYSPVEEKHKTETFKSGYGGIEITYAKANDDETEFKICGEDENVLSVAVDEIFNGETVTIEVGFVTTLPKANLRLGVTEKTVNLADFFPVACKVENSAFVECLYSPYGDPYYADACDYEVSLTVPSTYTAAASGYPEKTVSDGAKTTYEYSLSGGRDFAFVLSEEYQVRSRRIGDLTLYCYSFDDDETLADTSASALEYFSELYGDYPYKCMTVAITPFIHGGMEFSGLCYVADNLDGDDLKYAAIHEIAHEWWHCGVGNDQINAAYIDEGLAELSVYLYLSDNGEETAAKEMLTDAKYGYRAFYDIYKTLNGDADTKMNRSLNEFSSLREYVAVAYDKSFLMFAGYVDAIGRPKADKLLKKLYTENLFDNITLTHITKILGLKEHFISFVDGKVLI